MFAQALNRRRILRAELAAVRGARAALGRPILGQDQILDRGRHAVDAALRRILPPSLFRLFGGGQSAFLINQAKGVEGFIALIDSPERRLCNLDGRQAAITVSGQQVYGGHLANIVAHDVISL